MTRDAFVQKVDTLLKLVRTEYDLTQEQMAHCLGISKKTLVGIEKGRGSLGWTGAAAMCALFSQSTVLQNTFGGEMSDMLRAYAFEQSVPHYPRTMGGRIWWEVTEQGTGWKIQQNYISRHYRLLTADNKLICSSFDAEKLECLANELEQEGTL